MPIKSGGSAPAVILSGNTAETSGRRSLNEAALALTRSLGRRGVPVMRFHPDRSLADLRSRYCTHVPCPNLYDAPSDLVNVLIDFAARSAGIPVLFPASDGSARLERFRQRMLMSCRRLFRARAAIAHTR